MANSKKPIVYHDGIHLKPEATPTLTDQGTLKFDSAADKLKVKLSAATDTVVTEDKAATLENKTIVVASNTITTAASGNLAATELDAALAELQTDIDTRALNSDLTTHMSDTSTHGVGEVVGTSETQTLTNKSIDGDDNTITDLPITAIKTVVGDASKFLVRDASGIPTSNKTVPTGAVVGTTDTQTLTGKTLVVASNTITTAASGNLAATELNTALAELQTDIDTRATSTALTNHISDTSDAHDASAISYDNATSGLTSTQVNDAIDEVAAATLSSVITVVSIDDTDSPYTALTSTGLLLCDATNDVITVNLYAAAGNTGRVIRIKKTDSSTNAITIDGNGSETIDGATTKKCSTQNEELTLVCDGSNWHILSRTYPQSWVSFSPTVSWTTNTTSSGWYRRVGDSMQIQVAVLIAAGGPEAEVLSFEPPSGFTVDETKMYTGFNYSAGQFHAQNTGVKDYSGVVSYSPTNNIFNPIINDTAGGITDTAPFTWDDTDWISMFAQVPITDWE